MSELHNSEVCVFILHNKDLYLIGAFIVLEVSAKC